MLEIDGSVGEGGTTWISVNVLDALGANVVGIPVVGVSSGNTVEDDFQLAGPLNAGFYTWDLRYDAENNVHALSRPAINF